MGIWGKILDIFNPISDIVDELNTSDHEKLQAKTALLALQTEVTNNVIQYEEALVNAKRDIIVAEAQSDSWLTRMWRPITMLIFVGLTVWGFFSGQVVPPWIGNILTIGIGGYIGGRTLEKSAPAVIRALKSGEEV